MPLKHDTETLMVIILGAMIALAGIVAAFLPSVSVSVWPWAIAFIISLVYPLALYPMMKERRADYEFRALHFAPALILFAWLALDLLAAWRPEWGMLRSLYTWGWTIAVVAAAFVLLAIFCLSVIRQRGPRLGWLAAILVPFLILSQFSQRNDWDGRLAATLWPSTTPSTNTGVIASVGDSSSSDLSASSDGTEEKWRALLRRMERRSERLQDSSEESSSPSSLPVEAAKTGAIIAAGGLPDKDEGKGLPPPGLPSSGFATESLGLLAGAAYCAGLHRKTIKRRMAA